MKERPTPEPVVFVIDDDASVRDSLKNLLESVGLHAELFELGPCLYEVSPARHSKLPDPRCEVAWSHRIGVPERTLEAPVVSLPIIFITGHGDIPMSVRAMKLGAVEFLTKPFRDQELLEAVRIALDRDRMRRKKDKTVAPYALVSQR